MSPRPILENLQPRIAPALAAALAVTALAALPGAPNASGARPHDLPQATQHQARLASGPVTAKSGQVISGLSISSTNGPCIIVPEGVTHVVIEDNNIGPCDSDVDGVGISIEPKAHHITIRRNKIRDVSSGIYAREAQHPLVIKRNRVSDVRGPMPRGQMVQFDGVSGGSGSSRIVRNTSDKRAAKNRTRYEDHISLFKSSGTSANPIVVACNRIRGGDSETGSAIMTGDYGGGFVVVRDNTIVLTSNTGIGMAGAHDVKVLRNQIFNKGSNRQSKTSEAVTLFTYAEKVPRDITITDNRAIAAGWARGGDGGVSNGFWSDGSAVNLSESGNKWKDSSLTEAIWTTKPAACP